MKPRKEYKVESKLGFEQRSPSGEKIFIRVCINSITLPDNSTPWKCSVTMWGKDRAWRPIPIHPEPKSEFVKSAMEQIKFLMNELHDGRPKNWQLEKKHANLSFHSHETAAALFTEVARRMNEVGYVNSDTALLGIPNTGLQQG